MFVIDASVAVKFLVAEPGSSEATRFLESDRPLIAPDWVVAEVANALANKVALKDLSPADAGAAIRVLPEFFEDLHPCDQIVGGALGLASELTHAFYDCLYLELARREGATLITADRKFRNTARRAGYGEMVELLTWPARAA